MSSVAMASVAVRVLWMDDEPDFIENYREMLEKERCNPPLFRTTHK